MHKTNPKIHKANCYNLCQNKILLDLYKDADESMFYEGIFQTISKLSVFYFIMCLHCIDKGWDLPAIRPINVIRSLYDHVLFIVMME